MWLEKAAAPLHLLHGGFGIGSFIIPLIANPFLAVTKTVTDNLTTSDNVTMMPPVTMTTRLPTTTEVVVKESKMEYAYFIAAAIAIIVSIVFFSYHLAGGQHRRRQQKRQQDAGTDKAAGIKALTLKEMINPATCAGGRFFYGIQIFTLLFLYYIQTVGGERVGGKFIRAYSIKHVGFSEDDGSYINTVFWIAFTVGRVSGLLTARFIPIRILIMLESGGCMLSSIMLVIFGEKSTVLWILIPTLGFFIGPLFPSGVGWANYHIDVTGVAITFLMLGASVGGVVYMRLTGFLFDKHGYKTFLYILLGFGIASFVISAVMNWVGSQHGSRFKSEMKDTDKNINKTDDENTMENKAYMHEY